MSDSNPLPPPSITITRQTAVGLLGSPITLSREVSTTSSASDVQNPDEVMRQRLILYRNHLQHDIDFVNNEIHALIARAPSENPVEEDMLLNLRDDLKIRYNTLRVRLQRLCDLLEVM